MILATYKDFDINDVITIERAENGKYFNTYGVGVSPCSAGPFETYKDALTTLKRHRPQARQLNRMCENCKNLTNCGGTSSEVWTGCIYKEVKND